jgi:hypothetical protein
VILRRAAQRHELTAAELAVRLARYPATGWRRERGLSICPYPDGSLNAALWQALRLRDRDLGERAMRDIIRGT